MYRINIVLVYFFPILLLSKVILYEDPAQQINRIENYATRNVFLFVEKNAEGTVSLQVGPSPLSSFNQGLVDAGAAYIDCPEVITTYSAEEVASSDELYVTFNIDSHPNATKENGYKIYGILLEWFYYLDINSVYYNDLLAYKVPVNQIGQLNRDNDSTNNQYTFIYSDILNYYKWVYSGEGLYISENITDNIFYETKEVNTPSSKEITIKVDTKFLSQVSPGIYSLYFVFLMNGLNADEPMDDYLNNLYTLQTNQIIYLYRTILNIDAILNGSNTLYRPNTANTLILNTNKERVVVEYTILIKAMSEQWNSFSTLDNLSISSSKTITNMVNFIETYQGVMTTF